MGVTLARVKVLKETEFRGLILKEGAILSVAPSVATWLKDQGAAADITERLTLVGGECGGCGHGWIKT